MPGLELRNNERVTLSVQSKQSQVVKITINWPEKFAADDVRDTDMW
jgi:hypothetical protein